MTRALSSSDIDALLASAGTYRSTIVVSATRAAQELVWSTGRGDTLHASVGDMVVSDASTGDRWSVDADVFAATYTCVGGDQFRKTAVIHAAQVDEPFSVSTLEGTATGESGDWLVRNPTGECWPVTDTVFRGRYVTS
jgi:hypothetical protein